MPDGLAPRALGKHKPEASDFPADGKLLYGIRVHKPKVLLFALDIATGNEKVIGDVGYGDEPRASSSPSLRLSLSPDGK